MRNLKSLFLLLFVAFLIQPKISAQSAKKVADKVEKKLEDWQKADVGLKQFQQVKIDSVRVWDDEKKMNIYFAPDLSYLPFREEETKKLYSSISNELGKKYDGYQINIFSNKIEVKDLIPNWARKEFPLDEKRKDIIPFPMRIPLVRMPDQPIPSSGLYNNNLVLWPSHGYYYEAGLDRWEFQRARLFSTVEDLHATKYMLQYVVPMLENAGATVILPRERDTQLNEVVVDNDCPEESELIIPQDLKYQVINRGFLPKDTLFPYDKPFELGTSLKIDAKANAGKSVQYVPNIKERGDYAVYITYGFDMMNSPEVEYVVRHAGGATRFLVNQKIGGGTWIYLGTFSFDAGLNATKASVTINIKGDEGYISADAVRFGGGMGNVARRPLINGNVNYTWKLSGKPRYMEAARYYLQYSGMPDTLVYNLNKGKSDYTDDLQSRGEWINYLIGFSKPQYRSIFNLGLNIPVDLSLALHSDAGTTPNDSVVGTLCIYSTEKNNGRFPNGQSKMTSRDFADLVQTQIVDDLRKQVKTDWTRREMWDRGYSEAYRQIVPALLLELLSHQNAMDMRYSLDPRFRFIASRSIYKGILKYLAFQNNRPYVVQPLPVDHFNISFQGNKTVRLSWKPVLDSLEVTAKPEKYKVYKRIGNGGFDNGTVVSDTFLMITLESYDQIYSYKVAALNEGGESFPSEILSVGLKENAPLVLVVNAFNRISAPTFLNKEDMTGFAWWDDQGVPYKSEIGFTGNQYDFDRKSEWKDDDSPGWGASYANMEGKIIPGNTFDFTYVHGEAILAGGFSFVSTSDEFFTERNFNLIPYPIFDIILGEEKTTLSLKDSAVKDFQIYSPGLMERIKEIALIGRGLFLSGAYVGSDLLNTGDSTAIEFAEDVLHFQWRTSHAVTDGSVYTTDDAMPFFNGKYTFNSGYDPAIYTVEAPDAIEPVGINSSTFLRYRENNSSAGVAFKGKFRSMVCGFPFETIKSPQERKDFMLQVLNFLKNR